MFKLIFQKWSKLGILGQIIFATILACFVGVFFPNFAMLMKPWGVLILRLIKMIIVPLIFFSICQAVIDIKDATKAAKMGIGSFALYSCTTIFATLIAVIIAVPMFNWIVLPDLSSLSPSNIDTITSNVSEYGGIWDAIFRIIPSNMLASFVDGNTLSVIFFAVISGFLILKMMGKESSSKQGHFLSSFIGASSTLIYQFINVVVAMMPIAVFGYLAWIISAQDVSLLKGLAKMIGVGYLVLIMHVLLTYGTLMTVSGLSFRVFIKKFFPVQLFAFSTASSAATIPLNEKLLNKKLGVSKPTSGFVVPFGATVNMDGTAICQVVYAIFIAKLYGVSLGIGSYVSLAVMSSIISIGVAAVPSASLVTLGVVLGVVGIPLEGIGIIVATDRILDMARTSVNVTGDGVVSILMDKFLGNLNREKFYSKTP